MDQIDSNYPYNFIPMDRETRAFLKEHDIPIPTGNVMEIYGIPNMKALKINLKQDDFIEKLETFVRDPNGAASQVDLNMERNCRLYLGRKDSAGFVFGPDLRRRLRELKKAVKKYVQPAQFAK